MTNGVIDLDASTAGTYTIKYVTTGTCPDSSTQDVTMSPSPTVDLGADIAISDGTTQTLDAGSGHTNYLWSTGATTQTIDVTTSGTYSVTVGNGTAANNTNSLSFDGASTTQVAFNNLNNLNSGDGDYITVSFWMDWNDGDDCMPISLKYYDLIFYNNGFGFNHSVGDCYGVSDNLLTYMASCNSRFL